MSLNLGPIHDGENRIRHDFVEFSRLWLAVREQWRDDRCKRFEQEHLSSLGPALARVTASLHEFTDAIRKANYELQDSRELGELE